MSTFNLLDERWIPVRRASGACESIAPHELVDAHDPPVHLASPRPDFDAALAQFLIGLVQTCAAPVDLRAWRAGMRAPPAPADLAAAFAPVREAFHLLGSGPRFLQDFELGDAGDAKSKAVEQLLLDAPGEQTLEQNTNIFVRGNRGAALSLPMAATALLCLQLNALAGGSGIRTSLRGGGPLTTLVLGRTLWETVWLNVQARTGWEYPEPANAELVLIFPWLAPCRTSEPGGKETFLADVHPLQMFWGTPRRVRLVADSTGGTCALTGAVSRCVVRQYNTKNLGVNYCGAFEHPLTPYRARKPGEFPLSVKGGASAVTFMEWPSLVLGGGGVQSAKCIQAFFHDHRDEALDRAPIRLWITGYEVEKASVLRWTDAVTPIPRIDPEHVEDLRHLTRKVVDATREAENWLRGAVREAISHDPKHFNGDLHWVDAGFEARLEAAFFVTLHRLCAGLAEGGATDAELEGWLLTISNAAYDTFDQCAGVGRIERDRALTAADLPRLARARTGLRRSVSRDAKKLRKTLGLPETR